MSKRTGVFDVKLDVQNVGLGGNTKNKKKDMTIEKALKTVSMQMRMSGLRERTISDYNLHVNHFSNVTKSIYLSDITANEINV